MAPGADAHTLGPSEGVVSSLLEDTPDEAVLSLVQRHPMTLPEIQEVLRRWPPDQVHQAVERLEELGTLSTVRRLGRSFLVLHEARFR